jgi:hypothetical protein
MLCLGNAENLQPVKYYILYFLQQGYLFCMAQAQRSNGCGTPQSVTGDRVPLDHFLAADSDLLNNDAQLVVHDA